MVCCASPSGQNQKWCRIVLKWTNLLLFAIYHIPAYIRRGLHMEVLKNMCRWTFDKAADTNTETEGLNRQPFSYWTRWPTDFPDTFLLFAGAWTHQFSPQDPSKQRYSCKTSSLRIKKNKKSADLLSHWTDPQSAQKLNEVFVSSSWNNIFIISQK